jgi:hypothetical protein
VSIGRARIVIGGDEINLSSLLSELAKALRRIETFGQLQIRIADHNFIIGDNGQSNLIADYLCRIASRYGFARVAGTNINENTEAFGKGKANTGYCDQDLFFALALGNKPRWILNNLKQQDFEHFSVFFEKVFERQLSRVLWSWKYGEGLGVNVAAWKGGQLIAHYGGKYRKVIAFGEEITAVQVCDVMVSPEERGIMTKTGAMYTVTATFLELYQGIGDIPLSFGFPNWRAMKLGLRLGFYAKVGEIREVRWPNLAPRLHMASFVRNLRPESKADGKIIDDLWSQMVENMKEAVIGKRNWEYIKNRYLEHPERAYRILLVRARMLGTVMGALVLQPEEENLILMDWIGPLKNIPELTLQARRLAGQWGYKEVYGWISHQYVSVMNLRSIVIRDPLVSIPANAWVPQRYLPEQLQDRWWLTMGDTDFL